MFALTAVLSAVMGGSLGLLGGGGSILAVPLLVYVVGLDARDAIATSLLVVGTTSLAAMIQHARAGAVKWKVGAVFGGVAMVGAYLGGRAAAYVPASVLLALFAGMMVAAAIAMLRNPRGRDESEREPAEHSLVLAALEGLVVGAATGLVGAGGGFLVVPALVLFARLDMRAAIGTSTLVIAMKSFAGYAGHAAHVTPDLGITALVIGFAIVGAFAGVAVAHRIDPARLRRAFAWFVLAMAGVILYQQASPEIRRAVLVDRWPFWAGGVAIGAFVLVFLRATGKALGVSTGYYDACSAPFDPSARRSWRLPFLVGIVAGGAAGALLSGASPTTAMGMFDDIASSSLAVKAAVFGGGGVLLGFGARLAGGCTSGHGIVGTALLARSSLLATAVFMVTGVAVAHLALAALGGQL